MSTSAITDAPPDAELATDEIGRYSRARHIDEVKRLSAIRPLRSVWLIGIQWVVIVAALSAAIWFPHWWVYVLAAFVIATRQQALGVIVHDGAHWLLFKNRVLNDVVSDIFVAFPISMSTTLYRKTHFQHHRFVNTEDDCDLRAQKEEREWFEWPKTTAGFWWSMFRSITGLNAHRAWPLVKEWAPWYHLYDKITPAFPLRARIIYVVNSIFVWCLLIWGLNHYFWNTITIIALMTIPSVTLLNFFNRLRATSEHVGLTEEKDELGATRTIVPRWWERLTICPVGVNYHLEHHLFPSVPGTELSKLHKTLMQDDEYRERAHVTQGYAGVMRELMGGQT